MRIVKISLFILLFLVITGALAFVFIRYKEEIKHNNVDKEDAEVARILLSRVKDLKDVTDPVGVMDEFGNIIDVTDATIIDESNGSITKVTKYEIYKDQNGVDVKVKLKKQIENSENGEVLVSWIIAEPYEMHTRYFVGKIKEIRVNSLVFLVEAESNFQKFKIHEHYLANVKDYEKIFNFDKYDLKNSKGFFIPPDSIDIGFKRMINMDDFKKYLNKKISVQESITSFYKNSPESTTLSFKESY